MGSTAPLAIGTRGTIGSLVRREIEYFQKLELHRPEHGHKKLESRKYVGVSKSIDASAGSREKTAALPTLGSFLSLSWKRKRRSGSTSNSGRFLPSMCSAVDVCTDSSSKRFGGIPGYSYKSLKSDIDA